MTDTTERLRALNDALRTAQDPIAAMMTNGSLVITRAVADMGDAFVTACVSAVRRFDAFTDDNDPHGEHDMAFLDVAGERVFWKIDYYDRELQLLSPDPCDAGLPRRILTIGLASDY